MSESEELARLRANVIHLTDDCVTLTGMVRELALTHPAEGIRVGLDALARDLGTLRERLNEGT